MSFDRNYLNFITSLGNCQSWYQQERKVLHHRKLMAFSYLAICKILTLEQIKQITRCNSAILIRKDLSSYQKQGEIIREDFRFDGRYATYSLTKRGLLWVTKECIRLSEGGICPPEVDKTLDSLYKSHQKDKPSNHLVCINQAIIALLCSARRPLEAELYMERPVSLKNGNLEPVSYKAKDHIVPDLTLLSSKCTVFFEADTMQVRFSSPKGPAEKIAKYSMIYKAGTEQNPCPGLTHIIFSIQPGSQLEKRTADFSESELKLLRNPERLNTSLAVIRLAAELLNHTGTPVHTVNDILSLLKEKAPQFSSSLVQSPVLIQATVLLHCLKESGFGNLEHENIRKGVSHLTRCMEQETASLRTRALAAAEEKRKMELFSAFSAPGYKQEALLGGMSVSCCSALSLEEKLPCLIPSLYLSAQEVTKFLADHDIIDACHSPHSSLPLFNIETSGSSASFPVTLCNAYKYSSDPQEKPFTVCIENISDDIGGYMRACSFLNNYHSMSGQARLVMLVRDDFQLADGNYLNRNSGLLAASAHKNMGSAGRNPGISGTCSSFSFFTYSEFFHAIRP